MLNRRIHAIAESDRNTFHYLRPRAVGGCGLDAQWTDDFHHSLHTLLTGEKTGYYADFGAAAQLAKSFAGGFVYTGERSVYRGRRHGVPAREIEPYRHVVCLQNHDQVGNRAHGERISALVPFEGLKLGAAAVLLSPFTPLLFMGEEYGETAPFPYFVHHSDEELVQAVRAGRQEEFAAFAWAGEVPDPQSAATFEAAWLDHALRESGEHRLLFELYRELLRLRRSLPALRRPSKARTESGARERDRVVWVRRWHGTEEAFLVLYFGEGEAEPLLPLPPGRWIQVLNTAGERWGGPGGRLPEEVGSNGEIKLPLAGRSAVVLERV